MTKLYFYQSGIPENTEVDFSNPLHVELHKELTGATPKRKKLNKLMKDAGFEASVGLTNTPVWSTDLYLVERDEETNFIVKWLPIAPLS